MDHNNWAPNLNNLPVLRNFSWDLPLYIHDHPPGTLWDLFLDQHSSSSYLGKLSNSVVLISRLDPFILINRVLTLIYQHGCSMRLEYYTYAHIKFQMDSYLQKLGNYCYKQIQLSVGSLPTYLVCP